MKKGAFNMKERIHQEKETKCDSCCEKDINNKKKQEKKCDCNHLHAHGEKCGSSKSTESCGCHEHHHDHDHHHHQEQHHHDHRHHDHDERHEHSCACGCGHDHGAEKVDAKTRIGYALGACLLLVAFLGEFSVLSQWVSVPAAVLVYAFFGKDVWVGAWNGWKRGKIFTEFTLMCVATVGAAILLEFADAAAVMYLYSLGELIQGIAGRKSKDNISELIEVTDEYVNKVENESVSRVKAESVKVGDVINVTVGERISLDGVVVAGTGFADTSAVTGESAPFELIKGVSCLSGSVLIAGAVSIRVTEVYEKSTASKLKEAVERAAKRKAPTEKRIARFAEVFTPCAFAVSVLLFVACMWLWQDFARALKTALVVLVVSCPCSLVLSVPLAYFAGIGTAATRGIVFRGGEVIDRAARLGTVVFDKTGTLTASSLELGGVWLPQNAPCAKGDLLDICRCALEKSPHAAARSFCEIYRARRPRVVANVDVIGGRGVVCQVDGVRAAFGNRALMAEEGVDVADLESTAIYVALGGKLCGALLFRSRLKPEVLSELAKLRRNGVGRIAIMSGDVKKSVQEASEALGVSEFYAELKPDEKLSVLEKVYAEEKRRDKHGTVAFCGDGLNDAAVIARADVGIAMGSGSAVSVERADVVIVDDSIARVNDLIAVSKNTVRVVNQNIALSLGIKILVAAIGFVGLQSLELAIVADVGAAIITVLNALRAGRFD